MKTIHPEPSQQIRYNLLWLPIDEPPQRPACSENDTNTKELIYSKHSHYNPFQVAHDCEVDAWARHALASSGFGDVSS